MFITYQDARRVRHRLLMDVTRLNFFEVVRADFFRNVVGPRLNLPPLGRAQPVIPPNLYSMLMNIIAWGPQVSPRQVLRSTVARAGLVY